MTYEQQKKDQEAQLTALKESNQHLNQAIEEISKRLSTLERIESLLLHDGILAIYSDTKKNGVITDADYRRACELYSMNGNSDYIDNIMNSLRDQYFSQQK